MTQPYGGAILITGASSGIGKASAEAFARAGYTVFAAARSMEEKTESVGAGSVTGLRVDVTDEASVQRARALVEARGGVGILLNCAGMGIAGAAEDTPEAELRYQFEVNYFGVLRVNRIFMPLLRARGGGLVLIVSSVAGRVPVPYHTHYSGTKHALDCYAEALRMEAGQFGIRAALIQPGGTRTSITANRHIAVPEGSPYAPGCAAAEARFAHDEEKGMPPEKTAQAALKLAQMKNPPVRLTVGGFYKLIMLLRRIAPARLFEAALKKMYR
ncbi:MAG: SDR family oxidoreductase [Oscillospiraceae bacterium]|nr:SDR family oxidoreductase [Oscillospiraceae bacterium]